MTQDSLKILRENIIRGIELSYERLLASKQKNDEELVFSKDGKIVKVKARDLKK
jgi:hypothetical protein